MGDSGDEFDRQRREKFRRERSDIYERGGDREWSRERPRGWNGGGPERGPIRPPPNMPSDQRHRPDYPGQPPQDMKRRFSPGRREEDMGPRKRMRGFEPGFGGDWRPGPGWEPRRPGFRPPEEWGPGGVVGHGDMDKLGARMLTFKQWLSSQPDDISDEEAIKKYSEYKISFKRQQLQQFFIVHKEEEWFKEKYHPDDSGRREEEHEKAVRWRADIFEMLIKKGFMEDASLDLSNEDKIVRMLDSAVIFLEGGIDDDLKVLDRPTETNETTGKRESNGKTEEGEVKTEEGELEESQNPDEKQPESKKQAELFKQLVDDKKEPSVDMNDGETARKKKKKKRLHEDGDSSGSSNSSSSSDSNDSDEEKEKNDAEKKNLKHESKAEKKEDSEESAAKPKLLHQTFSIFMRSLPPSITRNDIGNLCKKFPGFLRVAFSQPIDDHNRFIRRCWVTFQRNVNIKDICWNLNNIRLREMELNPVVNRDLARRVRPISGIAQHKSCARNDLKNVARLIMHLDQKTNLWRKKEDMGSDGKNAEETKEEENKTDTGNPWLANISEFLVDESSAEEDELLGPEVGMEMSEKGNELGQGNIVAIQRDDKLINQLDILLYYLRLVHSVDYYNASQYPNEDEMPNRCGIVHARGPIPPNKLTREDMAEFQKRFSEKLIPILDFKNKLTKEETGKLGLKNEENEVEKFVASNTQELGKDKWLCPLSGKKFKGPDYVRKHIFNKHGEKVDAVKKEVAYYNNYLMDPCRPGPAEVPRAPIGGPGAPPLGAPGYGPYGARPPMYGEPAFGQFASPQYRHRMPAAAYAGGKTYPPKPREMRPREPYSGRPVVEYRDLDAPDDADFF